MGNSSYDFESRLMRSASMGYATKTADKIFREKSKGIDQGMDPNGIDKRECFDSPEHPNSVPILFSLDVTGSMGSIPLQLVRDGLPTLMSTLIGKGVPDAAVCFVPVGDHECDKFPLQIAQFESGDAELDHWLTKSILEGGGGGNRGESYALAWLVGARHTKLDSFDKRGKKGYLITIGDEPCLEHYPATAIRNITGASAQNTTATELLKEAQEMYNVYHIHLDNAGLKEWQDRLGQNCISLKKSEINTIPDVIANIVVTAEGGAKQATSQVIDGNEGKTEPKEDTKPSIML